MRMSDPIERSSIAFPKTKTHKREFSMILPSSFSVLGGAAWGFSAKDWRYSVEGRLP